MTRRWRLFPKYATLIIAVVAACWSPAARSASTSRGARSRRIWWRCRSRRRRAPPSRIEQYILDIEHQLGWTALPRVDAAGDALEQRRIEYLKLLRQVPAITELVWIDPDGRERLRVSRLAMDAVGAGTDLSQGPKFAASPRAGGTWFGPVLVPQGHRALHGDRAARRRRRRRDGGRGQPEVRLGRGVAHQDRRERAWPTWSMPPAR